LPTVTEQVLANALNSTSKINTEQNTGAEEEAVRSKQQFSNMNHEDQNSNECNHQLHQCRLKTG
jgi:hypothetical protein